MNRLSREGDFLLAGDNFIVDLVCRVVSRGPMEAHRGVPFAGKQFDLVDFSELRERARQFLRRAVVGEVLHEHSTLDPPLRAYISYANFTGLLCVDESPSWLA